MFTLLRRSIKLQMIANNRNTCRNVGAFTKMEGGGLLEGETFKTHSSVDISALPYQCAMRVLKG